MIIKIYYTLIAIIAFCFFSITNSNYNYNELALLDEWKNIKELKQDIDILDKSNIELNNEFEILNTDYKLKTFLKDNLTVIELNKIRALVLDYNNNKNRIELLLSNKARELVPVIEEIKLLLEEKRKLYSWLVPYINIDYNLEYLEYIKWDAAIFNEQKSVITDIIVKNEILNIKVETIESKIQEHKDYINESIKEVIESRLQDKIDNLNDNVTFKVLNNESKIKVLEKTILKIKIKLKNLENTQSNTNSRIIIENSTLVLDKKIQTYYIAVEKLELFKLKIK